VLRLNLAREQYLTDETSLFVGFSGQYGSRGLDSSEQFSLGGPSGVRAYPVGEAGGPSGAILNLEVRRQLSPQWRLTGFYDHAVVSDRDAPNEPSSYQLKGLGATLSWAGPDGWGADLTWAHRIGSNPNPIIDVNRGPLGNDQDGSLDENRLWFAVRKTF
jgi:hemolysin activation/secretion protein